MKTFDKDTLRQKIEDGLQDLYGDILQDYGIESGDIELTQLLHLEEAEGKLVNAVTNWIEPRLN